MRRVVFMRRRRVRSRMAKLARLRMAMEAAARVTAPHFAVPTDLILQRAGGKRPPSAETSARRLAMYLAHTSGSVPMRAIAEVTGWPFRGKRGVSDVMRSIEDMRDDPDFDALVSRLEADFEAEWMRVAP